MSYADSRGIEGRESGPSVGSLVFVELGLGVLSCQSVEVVVCKRVLSC